MCLAKVRGIRRADFFSLLGVSAAVFADVDAESSVDVGIEEVLRRCVVSVLPLALSSVVWEQLNIEVG